MSKIIFLLVNLLVIYASLSMQGALSDLIDLPGLLFVIVLVGSLLLSKYGKGFSHFFQKDGLLKSSIARDGMLVSPLCGAFYALSSIVIMLTQLSAPSEIAPALASSFVAFFYSLLISALIFYPSTSKEEN